MDNPTGIVLKASPISIRLIEMRGLKFNFSSSNVPIGSDDSMIFPKLFIFEYQLEITFREMGIECMYVSLKKSSKTVPLGLDASSSFNTEI